MSLASSRSVRLLPVLAVVALVATLLVAPPADAAAPILVGVHAGEPSSTTDMPERVRIYEDVIQRDVDVVNVFKALSMDNLVQDGRDTEEVRLLKSGHTLMVSWRAHEGCGTGPSSTPVAQRRIRAQRIAAGDFDTELREMAVQLDQLTDLGPVLLRWHWEMDQEDPSCQHIGTPAEYRAAWRHVHRVVSAIARDVQWVWAPRASSFNKDIGQQYFPGASYVDLIGGSAVPRASTGKEGAWRGPAEIFDTMLAFADSHNRPALVWVGVREKLDCLRPDDDCEWTPDATWKAGFINELRALGAGPWSDTVGVLVWYHDRSPYFDDAYDFRVDTSWRSRNAMRALVCDPAFGGCGTSGGGTGGGSGGGTGGGGTGGSGSSGSGHVAPPSGSLPVVGDWDGNGRDFAGWFKDGQWGLHGETGGTQRISYGRRGDIPVVGDWNGDGRDEIGIIRDREWHLKFSLSGGAADRTFTYGRLTRGDVPIVGDWNGDGRDGIGIIRDREWHLRYSLAGGAADRTFVYGRLTAGDLPVTGDWDGNGRTDIGVVRGGTWLLRNSLTGGNANLSFRYGRVDAGDIPVTGDWDRIGATRIGVVRNDVWYLRRSLTAGPATTTFSAR